MAAPSFNAAAPSGTLYSLAAAQALGANSPTIGLATDQTFPTFGMGDEIVVTPTVTAGAYTAGYVMGGIMTFASCFPANNTPGGFIAWLNSITLEFAGSAQTGEFDLGLFLASPAGTMADHGAPSITAAQIKTAALVGIYRMTNPNSAFVTGATYNLDGIGKFLNGVTNNVYAVLIAVGPTMVNPASTTDLTVRLGFNW